MPTTRVKRRFKLSKNELSDAEFLASVDREWIKVSRTLKRPNLEPLTFEDENKGTVKDTFGISYPCSNHFLRCIKFNLLVAIFAHINFPEHNEKNITQCLDISIPEIERLNKHPELFASKIVEEYFNYDVSQIRDTLIKVDLEMDKISEARDIFHESIEESFTDIFLFDETEERKSWQQFLHNNPQEGGYDDWYKPEAGSIQVIPTAAKLIIHKMKEDRRSVLQALGTRKTNPIEISSPTQTWTTAKQSTRIVTLAHKILPPFPGYDGDFVRPLAKNNMSSLESLNNSFHRPERIQETASRAAVVVNEFPVSGK